MTYVDPEFGGVTFQGAYCPASDFAKTVEQALPLRGGLMQDEWSGTTARSVEMFALELPENVLRTALQYPGVFVFDPVARAFALNFGPNGRRLRTGAGVTPAVSVAKFGGDLAALHEIANRLQFEGAQPFVVSRSVDQSSAFSQAPALDAR